MERKDGLSELGPGPQTRTRGTALRYKRTLLWSVHVPGLRYRIPGKVATLGCESEYMQVSNAQSVHATRHLQYRTSEHRLLPTYYVCASCKTSVVHRSFPRGAARVVRVATRVALRESETII